ncbi:hypothetical protein QYE76_020329 [Lolium multiflorum]|uniref:Transposase (putative) gypsy type domain-containing protein n=1 Tax=Lolium multiflorum TaxID=4521 RepID=A0AAD8R5P3_LOLMU|nr:hypothetical protein QYE76_020329 [Lolium multiflorum]
MENDDEEEEDDDMYPNYGDTATGHDEDEEAGGGDQDEEASDEPVDDDLRRAIADAHRDAETENEKRKLKGMLDDHKKKLYPNCEDGNTKLGATLELLQWKAEAGICDKPFEKLLKIMKRRFPKDNELPDSTYEAKKVLCPLGLEVLKIHACINDCILYRLEYENLEKCPPRRQPDLNSDELRRRDLRARSLQASLRSKIAAVDREISPPPIRGHAGRFSASSTTFVLAGTSSVRRAIDAGSMPIDSHCTGSSPNSPDPSSLEPICPDPIAYLPPYVSDIRLAQPFSASSSTKLSRIPTAQEIEEELQGQARMAAKVQETENKKASKARNREGERGQWWPCETTDTELRELQNEGMISAHWSFIRDTVVPKPGAGEVVMTKAWVERGLSLPCSEFFLSILTTYGLQPHNICPNSYLLLSNFATLCEGHLGIRPDVKLWQFFFRVKKETKDKAMLNCGSMTFMLRPGRMYPPHDSHESVRYWNAGWFYEKNVSVPEIHDGLPKFNNEPPEELASWSFIPPLSLTPILEKAARRISWLVHDGLTGTQLTLSWFTRRIQPLRYNARLICAYTGADDQLRATRHDLPADSLKRRFKTLVKVGRGQPIPELIKDIYTNDQCPPLATLAEENLRTILRVPVSGDTAEEVPEDEEEEEEQAPRKVAPDLRSVPAPKLPAPKPELAARPPPRSPRATPTTATGTASQELITKFMKKSPAVGPATPAPPSASHTAPPPSPPQADQSPPPAANTPPEIIPVSSEKVGGEDPKAKGPAQEETQDQGEAEVTSSEKVGAGAGDVVVFPKNFGDPADLTSTPKAYATKIFKQLTEAEKWELEQDLLNAMLNAWGKPDAGASSSLATTSSELENLRSSYQELEIKLKEAEQQKEQAEKQLAEKNSELIREKGEFVLKRNADSETIKRQQKELNGLRKYMETAEHHWDLLAENILEPLGYPEKRRNKFPRDDVLSLAGDDCKDLISASRKICHNLSLKRTCGLRKLIKRMDILPELVTDLQASSARGAAAMTLTMCLAHNPKMDLDRVTSGVPPTADVGKLLDAVSGYDTRIARRIRHEEFYDKVVLPADEPLEDELQKERDAEARPAESGTQFTWTSSKDAPEEEEPKTSAATSDEDEESDEDVSSPAEGAKGKDPEGNASPSKAE